MDQTGNITFLKPVLDKLFKLMNRRHKIYLVLLIILTIGFALIETVGISAIMPFISLAADPALVESGWYKKAFDLLGFINVESFIITMGIAIVLFYVFRAVYSVFLTYYTHHFSSGMYKYLSKKIFNINLSLSYRAYAQKNSAELMRSITTETHEVSKIIVYTLHICSEIFIIAMIYVVIVLLNWKMTLIITFVLLFMVIFLLSTLARISKAQGAKRLAAGKKMNRNLKETLANFKYVKLKGNEEAILSVYDGYIETYTRSEMVSHVLGNIPKSILESIGFSFLVAAVVFIIWVYHDASKVIPTISMYALALYRILPSVYRMLQNINHIAYAQKTLESVEESLRQPVKKEGTESLAFTQTIRLENINFEYATGGEIFGGLSLAIKKGERVAIIGESGGGKSTLIDIITGIHQPNSGKVYIDDTAITDNNVRSWRKKIGYIPQSIYLYDGTVAENVAFGSEPDDEKIKTALQKANIWDFLAQKEGLNTRVGDGGIQLSGGQQQRIGIARALYDDPEVLALDEATSSLDTDTEQKIMDEIYNVSANKTLIVIAHRLSTVERCDRKIRIENGRII